ncbi:MAG: energy-coupling factor ABC transporter ATP-binding protein [Cyanobacteria bacterium J06642_2]
MTAPISTTSIAAAIAVSDLTFAWPNRAPILQHCNLCVPRGQLWMVMGANGSGKSTLLQLLAGLLPCPATASIQIDKPVGYVFQNPDRQLIMPSVGADVAFSLTGETLSHAEVRWRVTQALELVGLQELMRRPIHALSGGQKHRVAIAGALARHSRVMLLDEPTALLDPDSQLDLIRTVRQLVDRQGITAVWITHRLDELDWADRAVLLSAGCVRAEDTPSSIRKHLK